MARHGETLDHIAAAVADGVNVDWRAASTRTNLTELERATLVQLGDIATIARAVQRPGRRIPAFGSYRLPLIPKLLTLAALVRIGLAVACLIGLGFFHGGWPPGILPQHVLVTAVFGASGVVLLKGNRADRRAAELGVLFLLVATSFANGLYGTVLGAGVLGVLRAVPVDCFLPYALWRFIQEFPESAPSHASRWINVVVKASLVAGAILLLATAAATLMPTHAAGELLQLLARRSAKGTIYWTVVFALVFAGVPALVWRTVSAGVDHRKRGWLFLAGLTIGLAPLSINIVLETLSPGYRAFSTTHREVIANVAITFLLTIPVTTAYAVLVRQILAVRILIRRTVRYSLARTTILWAVAIPFALIVEHVYTRRDMPVALVFGGGSVRTMVGLCLGGLCLLKARSWILERLDRAFFRPTYRAAEAIGMVLEDARKTAGLTEFGQVVVEHITTTLQVHYAALMVSGPDAAFQAVAGNVTPLSGDSALAVVMRASAAPLYINLDTDAALSRLPESDLFWLVDHDVAALTPIHGSTGLLIGLLVIGHAKSDEALEVAHSAVITAVAAGLGGPLEQRLKTTQSAAEHDLTLRERAEECMRCGEVNAAGAERCRECGGKTVASVVPQLVAGKFRISRRLGRGGMGVVYQGTDLSLGRVVAIKTLPRVSPEHAARLRREGRTMATLSHPNLATLFAIETWRGTPLLIVEHFSKGTLADRLMRGPMSLAQLMPVIAGILEGLRHAHARGILHRDLKPSNIGLTADGTAKLLDFGLAQLVHAASSATADWEPCSDPTEDAIGQPTDRRAGTAVYMAPEAIRGDTPGPHFDLWSVGIVMVEGLTGSRPFRDAATAVDQLTRGQLPDWRAVLAGQPGPIVAFLNEALDADPRRRPRSAESFVERLNEIAMESGR